MDPFYLYSIYEIFAAYVCLLLIAAILDIKSFVIPNWTAIALAALFLVPAAVLPFDTAWVSHLGGAAAVFIAGLVAYRFRVLGAGDVKSLTAVSLWTGFDKLPALLLYVALSGAVLVVAVFAIRCVLLALAARWQFVERVLRLRFMERRGKLPYGVAIASGAILIANGLPQLGLYI